MTEDISGLLDTGAGEEFMDYNYAKELGLEIMKLDKPIKPRNIDGTLNIKRQITEYVKEDVEIEDHIMRLRLLLTGLGQQKIILGLPWFQEYNPDIDWKNKTDRKSTRLNSSHSGESRMPSSA